LLVGEVGKEVLKVLKAEGALNTKQVARRLGKNYHHVRDVLYELQRKDLVKSEMVKRYAPLTRTWVVVNEWSLTAKGEAYLARVEKKGGQSHGFG
jgi:predicted ArsR family transcriptional regulator